MRACAADPRVPAAPRPSPRAPSAARPLAFSGAPLLGLGQGRCAWSQDVRSLCPLGTRPAPVWRSICHFAISLSPSPFFPSLS